MKKFSFIITTLCLALILMSSTCSTTQTSDQVQAKETERSLSEANKEIGQPNIVNFQEKKFQKMIYELCDQEDLICYAYLMNAMTGEVGQYLGECIGYGIPYSTQFSNPEKRVRVSTHSTGWNYNIPQAEPNGMFKPIGLSATWLIMVHPQTAELHPMYVEPEIIVSPWKLH